MNPRTWLISSLFLLQCWTVYGQYYETKINDLADVLLIKADSLFDLKEYQSAESYFQKSIDALGQEVASISKKQNLHYLELRKLDCEFGLNNKEKVRTQLDSLIPIIKREFGKENLILGLAYFLRGKSWSTYEEALDNYSLAADIRTQLLPPGHKDRILSIEKLARVHRVLKNKAEAEDYSKKFLFYATRSSTIDTAIIIRAYSNLGNFYFINHEYESAKNYLDSSYQLAIKHLPPNHKYIKVAASNLASVHGAIGNFELQEDFLQKTIELNKNSEDKNLGGLSSAYMSLGMISRTNNDLVQAQLYLDTAKTIIDQFPETNFHHEVLYRIRASNLERRISIKIEHLEKALAIIENYPYILTDHIGTIYNNLAVAYSSLGIDYKRKLYLEKSLELRLSKTPNDFDGIASVLLNLASFHFDQSDYNLAQEFNTKSFEYRKKSPANTQYLEPIHWFQRISIALVKDDLSTARSSLDSSLQLLQKLELDSLHYLYGSWHLKKAKIENQSGHHDLALKHSNKAIEIQKDDIGFGSVNKVDALTTKYEILTLKDENKLAQAYLIHLLNDFGIENKNNSWSIQNTSRFNLWKAYSILNLYQKNYLSSMSIDEAESFIKVGASLIGKIRTYYLDNISQVEFYKSIKAFLNTSIDYLYESNSNKSSKKCQDLIVDLIFMSRNLRSSKGLLSHTKKSEQKEIDTYLLQSDMLLEQVKKLSKNGLSDSLYIQAKGELFDFEKKAEFQISQRQPLKSIENEVEFDQFNTLSSRLGSAQSLIYYYSEDYIYNISICNKEVTLFRLEKQKIDTLTAQLNPLLTDWALWQDATYSQNSDTFIRLVDSLSHLLLNHHSCSSSQLVVFADGNLLDLPFDILFTEKVKTGSSFRNLPYLIHKKQVSYATTTSQLKQNQSHLKGKKNYLGIASHYSNKDTLSLLRNENFPLYYNQLEVSQTQNLIEGGRALVGKEATKSAFLSNLNDVDWLHLAVHAKFDDEVTYQSYLSFTQSDSIDNNLYAFEIADLNLDVDLAVLSACETNKGKTKNGLGLLGIARAFQISGCNNLIITNWLVDDAASQQIVTEMFRQKVEGFSSPSALHQSKLHYLNNASEKLSHPIYWAGFNYYGTIKFDDSNLQYWLIIFPLVFIFLIFLRKKFQ